ncbi:hypothetical protein O181_023149 [Austropuccinia psidii MF-1]|uniref:Retroviral polymerase SH3-like domain-containing protein n=1 Tax=Austropuccinia psidii MF-1 TaxID=1389203 RepID=A0A9Q3CDW5_9BASI|nr:hypothetical protein [Austropuccinia psidii MF-1]
MTQNNIHPFGCTVFIKIDKSNLQSKLTTCAAKDFFLGYSEGHKNYRVYKDCIKNKNHSSSSINLNIQNSLIPSTSLNPQEEVNQTISIQHEPSENNNDIQDSPIDEYVSDSSISHPQNSSTLTFKTTSEAGSIQDKSSPESPSLSSREIKRSDNTHLPKGWVMDTVPEKAPRDIIRSIHSSNISYEKRQ